MNVDVMVNGRTWTIAVEPAGDKGELAVTIEGRTRVVDASWIDSDTLSLLDGRKAHEIRFHRRGDNGASGVEIGGTLYEAVVLKRGRKTPPDPLPGGGRHEVKSPMPGRVVRVLVGVGDRVAQRQPVIVVEAMKMENELRTSTGGTVKEVAVVPGAAVETGAVLVVVDP
jgi:biotin carboxyl carrier protein